MPGPKHPEMPAFSRAPDCLAACYTASGRAADPFGFRVEGGECCAPYCVSSLVSLTNEDLSPYDNLTFPIGERPCIGGHGLLGAFDDLLTVLSIITQYSE